MTPVDLGLNQKRSSLRAGLVTWVAVAMLVPITAACSQSEDADAIEDSSIAAFDDLRADVREWNRAAAMFVEAYLDPDVGAEEFLAIADPAVDELEGIHRRMRGRDLSGAPRGVEAAVDSVITSYGDKLGALTGITTAVRIGDAAGEQRAVAMLERATQDGIDAACSLADVFGSDEPQLVAGAEC